MIIFFILGAAVLGFVNPAVIKRNIIDGNFQNIPSADNSATKYQSLLTKSEPISSMKNTGGTSTKTHLGSDQASSSVSVVELAGVTSSLSAQSGLNEASKSASIVTESVDIFGTASTQGGSQPAHISASAKGGSQNVSSSAAAHGGTQIVNIITSPSGTSTSGGAIRITESLRSKQRDHSLISNTESENATYLSSTNDKFVISSFGDMSTPSSSSDTLINSSNNDMTSITSDTNTQISDTNMEESTFSSTNNTSIMDSKDHSSLVSDTFIKDSQQHFSTINDATVVDNQQHSSIVSDTSVKDTQQLSSVKSNLQHIVNVSSFTEESQFNLKPYHQVTKTLELFLTLFPNSPNIFRSIMAQYSNLIVNQLPLGELISLGALHRLTHN